MTNAIINALFITGGVLFLALALFHAMFWRLFNWSSQLEKLHPVNKGAMQAMNVALIMVFLFFAMVSFCLQLDLIHSKLGMYTLGFISVFCLVRSIVQWPFFTFKTMASRVFSILCLCTATLYGYLTYYAFHTVYGA